MSRVQQYTLSRPILFEGVGVHTGLPSRMRLLPAESPEGILFRRVDLPGSPAVRADVDSVSGTDLGTSIRSGEAAVQTVEHLMAALAAVSIGHLVIEMEGPEPPIADGSFLPFVQQIRETGLVPMGEPVEALSLPEPIQLVLDSGERYVAVPNPGLRLSTTIDFSHSAIGRSHRDFRLAEGTFDAELAPARTFGFEDEAARLRERGLALGASLENTVVLGGGGVLNPDGLRFPDEFVRHKTGDLLGDLALLGVPLDLHIIAERPSHRGNVAFARAIRKAHQRASGAPIVDVGKIMQVLPHRYPMLLVDRILEFETGTRIVGLKNVTINEPFFQGHYPGHPVMPGVLIIEAMAQVGGLLLMDAIENPEEKVVYFMSLDGVKWRRPVTPGDQLRFHVEMLQFRRQVCRMKGEAFVEGHLVAEAEFMARIVDR